MILFALVLLGLVGVLTAVEMATFSARPERMRQATDEGDRRGSMVLVYQRSPIPFITAAQVLTTLATFSIGLITSQLYTEPFSDLFRKIGLSERLAEDLGSGALLIVLTIVTLVVSNVVPKQVGFVRANEVAIAAARPMWLWIRITAPIGWIVLQTSKFVARLLGAKPDQPHRVTERDILHLIEEGAKRGGLDSAETDMVKRVLALSDLQASQVMTKVNLIEWIDTKDDPRKVTKEIERSSHSFFPVAESSLDSLRGILKAKDWLALDSPALDRVNLMPAVFVRPDSSLIEVLHALAPVETKAAFVKRKDGAIIGMISLNDAVQAVTGPLKGA